MKSIMKSWTFTGIVHGYADHIKINYHDYCYRLEGDGGQLILADTLEDETNE